MHTFFHFNQFLFIVSVLNHTRERELNLVEGVKENTRIFENY